ncbi:hypothetical protein D3C73_834100 [compost metagenome]
MVWLFHTADDYRDYADGAPVRAAGNGYRPVFAGDHLWSDAAAGAGQPYRLFYQPVPRRPALCLDSQVLQQLAPALGPLQRQHDDQFFCRYAGLLYDCLRRNL